MAHPQEEGDANSHGNGGVYAPHGGHDKLHRMFTTVAATKRTIMKVVQCFGSTENPWQNTPLSFSGSNMFLAIVYAQIYTRAYA